MAEMITPNAIQYMIANPISNSSEFTPIVVQVTQLKQIGNADRPKYTFVANDGKNKVKAILQSDLRSEVESGIIQQLGLIRILEYTVKVNNSVQILIVAACQSVSPALDGEYEIGSNGDGELASETKTIVESEGKGIVLLKPKQEITTMSAKQIANEQQINMAPAARMAMTRRVLPLVSLSPYQGNWTIKVRVTSKGDMRHYTNARGAGCVFNVELTDEDGTQIQATMFNAAAQKFYDKFVMGNVYYISKGTLKLANKQYKTVQNEYEMTLNESSVVEEAVNEVAFTIPETKFDFVPIDELGRYINRLVDVTGVVQSVSESRKIKRKNNGEEIPKRDIIIADSTKKTVTISLWNGLANDIGQQLYDMSDRSPVIAIKSVKVGEYQGVSLSALSNSVIVVNPETPEAKNLKSWFDAEGKDTAMPAVGEGLPTYTPGGAYSMYKDRVRLGLAYITSNPSLGDPNLGDKKPAFFSIKAYVSYIKPDQAMWYEACKQCNKKVTETSSRCDGCGKDVDGCNLRYMMTVKVFDALGNGDGYVTLFNEAEKIIGYPANELNDIRSEDPNGYEEKLKEATMMPYVCRVSVAINQYNGESKQKITLRSAAPVDFTADSKFLLEEIAKMMEESK